MASIINYNADTLNNLLQVVLTSGVTSDQWTAAYTSVTANSGLWNAVYNTVVSLSTTWAGGGGLSAVGPAGQIQFSNGVGGTFNASNALTFNNTASSLSVPNITFAALTGTGLSFFNNATACNAFITFQVGTSSYGINLVRV